MHQKGEGHKSLIEQMFEILYIFIYHMSKVFGSLRSQINVNFKSHINNNTYGIIVDVKSYV